MSLQWKPSVTVAALIERKGRYLLVEEHTPEGIRLNQPAGHLELGESLLQAVVRETLEETARPFVPDSLVGVYLSRWIPPGVGADDPRVVTYLRFAFTGNAGEAEAGRTLDAEIIRTLWLTADELRARAPEHRSPLVQQCVDDHAAGRRFPLELLFTHPSVLA